MSIELITNPESVPDSTEAVLDVGLRPQTLTQYIGQEPIKKNLHILLSAAKKRQDPVEHILLHGGPGLGKTTLAQIIAKTMQASIRITSGPAIEKTGDLAALLTNLQPGDVLFIDEIHRLHKAVEELLYPAMEDYCLDIMVGKGPAARSMRLELPHFTLIGATTRMSLIAAPLRDRFGAHYQLELYSEDDIAQIVERSAGLLNITIDHSSAAVIAKRSRRTPRIANRLLKRVRDVATVEGHNQITADLAMRALDLLDVDHLGLNLVDRKIIMALIDKFNGGPVGVATLAAATAEEVATVEEVHEPFLMQIGFLTRTARGRQLTEHAYKHMGIPHQAASRLDI